jgi:signal peptidase
MSTTPEVPAVTRLRRWIGSVAGLALLAALAFVLWPSTLGGAATFVVVRGDSMEPTYHKGDLLYARGSRDYDVGDIAVYRIPKHEPGHGALVVHRIKRVLPNDTYEFQGDNKSEPDDAKPAHDGLVAKPLANLGPLPTRLLLVLPLALTILAAIAVTYALWPERERGQRPADATAEPTEDSPTEDGTEREQTPALVH